MSRLTKQLREAMLKTMIDHAFSAKEQAAEKAKILVGEKIYTDIYGAHLIAMESLPKGYLARSTYVYIAIAGQVHNVKFNEYRLVGRSHSERHGDKAKMYVGDEPLALDFLKAVDAVSDIQSQRKAMEREVSAVLDSIPTFKKLWEVWPESKSVLEKYEVKPAIAILPAVQVGRLNDVLGLPAKTEEADNV